MRELANLVAVAAFPVQEEAVVAVLALPVTLPTTFPTQPLEVILPSKTALSFPAA